MLNTSKDSEPQRGATSVSLSFLATTFVLSVQNSFSLVGIPILHEQRLISEAQLGYLLGCYPLATAIVALVAGPLSDLIGRRKLILFGYATLSAALTLHIFAHSFADLLLLRLWAGGSSGMLVGLPSAYASDCFRTPKLHRVISRILCGYAIGHTIGFPLGVFLLDIVSFNTLSFFTGMLCLLAIPFVSRALKPDSQPTSFESQAALSYLRKLISTGFHHFPAPLFGLSFLTFFASSMIYVSATLWLLREFTLSPSEIAPMFLLSGLLQTLLFLFATPRLNSFGTRNLLMISLVLQGFTLIAGAPLANSSVTVFILFSIVTGFTALRIPTWHVLVTNHGIPSQKGMRMSLFQAINMLGKSVGTLCGSLGYSLYGAPFILILSGCLLLLCGISTLASKTIDLPSNSSNTWKIRDNPSTPVKTSLSQAWK